MADSTRDELLTVREITQRLKVHEETVRRWIREGELPAILLGSSKGGYRVKDSDLNAFLSAQAEKGKAAA